MSELTSSNGHHPAEHDGDLDEPIPNPGLPEHQPRPTDVDPALERRAERQVAGMFGLATLLGLAFCVAYFAIDPSDTLFGYGALNLALGGSLGLALLLIGLGAIQWARKLMADHEIIEYRHPARSSDEDREVSLTAFRTGAAESGFGRRTLIRNSLLGALGVLGLPAVVMLRDLGPLPGTALEHTVWRKGVRIVNDVAGTPIKPGDLEIGQLVNAEPASFFPHEDANGKLIPAEYEGVELNNAKAKAAVILVRMQPSDIHPIKSQANWGYSGILCYSKNCTHVVFPLSLLYHHTLP
jgi:ubiquinol-cytochrome c reductase iron-sulfur subunit